jgi:hypothetical protein
LMEGMAAVLLWTALWPITLRADEAISVAELDRALARRVREFVGPALSARLVINSHNGWVTLRGTVDSPEKRRGTEEKAEEIAGQKVVNQIQIAVNTQK